MILFTMFIIEGRTAHRGVKTLFFIRFGTIFTSKVYIFKTLSTKIQTECQNGKEILSMAWLLVPDGPV